MCKRACGGGGVCACVWDEHSNVGGNDSCCGLGGVCVCVCVCGGGGPANTFFNLYMHEP